MNINSFDNKFGLGLRSSHYQHIFDNKPNIDWFEIISENFIDNFGKARSNLNKIRENYPIVMHGVSLSIGSTDPLNSQYLKNLKKLIKDIKPLWVSDHLCWTGINKKNTHDLLPLPYNEESLKHIVKKIKQVQDYLEMKIAFENPSTYLEFNSSNISEASFIKEMAIESNCDLLLDVNNVYVSCFNHGNDCKKYIDELPIDKIRQIHLSGHTNKGTHIIDTHDNFVVDEVWNLYKYLINKAKRIPATMVEWDGNIPEFGVLYSEIEKAKKFANDAKNYQLPKTEIKQKKSLKNFDLKLSDAEKIMQNAILKDQNYQNLSVDWIVKKEKISQDDQLKIYSKGYQARLFESVAEDYEALDKYLGEKKFNKLIKEFIRSEQSNSYNIANYSFKLIDFLKKKISDKNNFDFYQNVFALELATLESSIISLSDPKIDKILTAEKLQKLSPEKLINSVLIPIKALKIHKFSYAVNLYYQQIMEKKKAKKPIKKNCYLVVYRENNKIWRIEMKKNEFNLFSDIVSGSKISEALEKNQNLSESEVFSFFSKWLNNQLFAECV